MLALEKSTRVGGEVRLLWSVHKDDHSIQAVI